MPWELWVLPTAGALRRGGGCQSRTPFPPVLDPCRARFGTACNAVSSKNPALRTAAALKTPSCHPAKQRLGLCQPRSAGPPPVCVCGLTSFAAVHWVPPRHADINKVTRTNTPCLFSSLPPALTLSKYDRYVPRTRALLRHPRSGPCLPPGLSDAGFALQS